jgi:hypothetical protein
VLFFKAIPHSVRFFMRLLADARSRKVLTTTERKTLLMNRRLVVHCKRESFDVYVGRPGKWGNPFPIGQHASRAEVIERYRRYLESRPDLVAAAQRELRGKVLGCWCAPLPCHGDVLAEIANRDECPGAERQSS